VAKIELSAEVKAIESLIDTGQQGVAASRLQAAHASLGRRPEYRYLVCLYDSKFRVRPDRELLRDVVELVGEQPDLMEATALLAELYARTGDDARADLFARLALESPSPSARQRANQVLAARASQARANDGEPGPGMPSSHVKEIDRPERRAQTPPDRPPKSVSPPAPPTELDMWFERARRELVHRRSPTYGVRSFESIVEMLLDWGKTVAQGSSFVSSDPLPLTRDSLAKLDDAVLALRRQPGARSASKSDTSRAMAAAGFFLAVVLHELEANVIEIAADDGGCKVLLPSGAGTRPLLVAAAFVDGTGPSMVQTFDRLTAARGLASGPPSSDGAFRPRPSSSARFAPPSGPVRSASPVSPVRPQSPVSNRPPPSPSPRSSSPAFEPSAQPSSAPRDVLALTRPEVEASPLRRLDRPPLAADSPPLDLARIASALATSPVSQDIAARSGAFLSPQPASIEALESFCLATRGEAGAAPEHGVWQPSDEDEEIILSWGAFLGETIIAAYGGIWECDPNAPNDHRLFRVICDDRVGVWPITQVYLRLKNGTRHDLMEYVATVGRLLG
jgi:hypothetical protein